MNEQPSLVSPLASGKAPIVSERIEVWWGGDRAYYPGVVSSINPDGTHKVAYDDGEIESVDLRLESWRSLNSGDQAEVKNTLIPSVPIHSRRRRRKPNSAYAKISPEAFRNPPVRVGESCGPKKNDAPKIEKEIVATEQSKNDEADKTSDKPEEKEMTATLRFVGSQVASSVTPDPATGTVAVTTKKPSSSPAMQGDSPGLRRNSIHGGKNSPPDRPVGTGDPIIELNKAKDSKLEPLSYPAGPSDIIQKDLVNHTEESIAVNNVKESTPVTRPCFVLSGTSSEPSNLRKSGSTSGRDTHASFDDPTRSVAPSPVPTNTAPEVRSGAFSAATKPHVRPDPLPGAASRTLASAAPLSKSPREGMMDVERGTGSATDTEDDEIDPIEPPATSKKRREPTKSNPSIATDRFISEAGKRRRLSTGQHIHSSPTEQQKGAKSQPGPGKQKVVGMGGGNTGKDGNGCGDILHDPLYGRENQGSGQENLGNPLGSPPGCASRKDLLPLDHVMTAVVQATVMILDQRLRPIADRLDELSDEVRQRRVLGPAVQSVDCKGPGARGGPPGVNGVMGTASMLGGSVGSIARTTVEHGLQRQDDEAKCGDMSLANLSGMVQNQHAECMEKIDGMRKELKRLRSDHKGVVDEALNMKGSEMRAYIDSAIDRVSRTISESAGHGGQESGHAKGMFENAPHDQKRPRADSNGIPHGYHADPFNSYGGVLPQHYASSPRQGYSLYKGPETVQAGRHENILSMVSRAVSTWILETQHECPDGADKSLWADHTATSCLYSVAKQLRTFHSFGEAMSSLSRKLSEENAELAWFSQPENPNALHLARRNYSAWDPPPSDEEWSCEIVLLSVLANRFHYALRQCRAEVDDLSLSINAVELAAVSAGGQS